MKKCFICPKLWLSGLLAVGLVGCYSDDESLEQNLDSNVPVITEGMELNSELLRDGEIIEKAVDKIVNFGTADDPVLFAVNKSHEVKGKAVPEGLTDIRCSFYTLTRAEYERFIPIYARAVNIASSDKLTPEERVAAFTSLADYLKRLHIEAAPLVYLMTNDKEAKAVMEIIEGADLSGSTVNPVRGVLEALIRKGVRASEYVDAAKSNHMTMANLFLEADRGGVNLARQIRTGTPTDQFVLRHRSQWYTKRFEFTFLEDGKGVVELFLMYTQLYHTDDRDILNYDGTIKQYSPSYECRYGSKKHPMAVARFHFKNFYNGRNVSIPGVNFIETVVELEEASHSLAMHCDGTIAYEAPQMRMEGDLPVGIIESEAVVEYGDCCAVRRTGRVHYLVDGLNGFQELFWDDNE